MHESLDQFNSDIASALALGREAERKLIDQLRAMTSEQFARVPRDLLDRLSSEQYRSIVSQLAPDQRLPDLETEPSFASVHRSAYKRWSAIPLTLRALSLGAACALLLPLILLSVPLGTDWWNARMPPVRLADVSQWPRCARLDPWADGCTYLLSAQKSWRTAARQLELPESYLRRLNYHIDSATIPEGALLVVWRERGTIEALQ